MNYKQYIKFLKKEVVRIKTKDMFEKEAIVVFIDVEEIDKQDPWKTTYLLVIDDYVDELINNFIKATPREVYEYMQDWLKFKPEPYNYDEVCSKHTFLFDMFYINPIINGYFDTEYWEDARNRISLIDESNYITSYFEQVSIMNAVNNLIIEKYYKEQYLEQYEKYYIINEKQELEKSITKKVNKI